MFVFLELNKIIENCHHFVFIYYLDSFFKK